MGDVSPDMFEDSEEDNIDDSEGMRASIASMNIATLVQPDACSKQNDDYTTTTTTTTDDDEQQPGNTKQELPRSPESGEAAEVTEGRREDDWEVQATDSSESLHGNSYIYLITK